MRSLVPRPLLVAALSLACLSQTALGAVQDQAVEYKEGDTVLQGHLYYDDAIEGQRPGILLVHEWWGLNDHAKTEAKRLAEAGYVALAVDMYGEGKTTEHPEEAMAFAQAARKDPAVTRARFEAGLEQLKAAPQTDPARIAAIGYCFGGTVALDMARAGMELAGVVSFHGGLAGGSGAEPGTIKAKILVCHGAADPMNPPDVVAKFLEEMNAAQADYTFVAYGGAQHSFTSATADARGIPGIKYDAHAHHASWQAMLGFFDELFGQD